MKLPIELARTTLRELSDDDLPAYADMHARADVARYLYWEPRTWEQSRVALQRKIATGTDPASIALAVSVDGTFIGELNLHTFDTDNRGAEMGFVFHPEHHGQGYATEAAAGLLAVAFGQLGLHRVIGRCDARNIASARVMRRLGMRLEAYFRSNELVKGEWCDEQVFALLEDEYRAGGAL